VTSGDTLSLIYLVFRRILCLFKNGPHHDFFSTFLLSACQDKCLEFISCAARVCSCDVDDVDDVDSMTSGVTSCRRHQRHSADERPTSIADRLSQLYESRESWRSKVEEKDVDQFTVAGKMNRLG